jgi:hypothetical protein
VLALPAVQHSPANFLHLEIQPEELDVFPNQVIDHRDPNQVIDQVNEAGEGNLNVGMALFPDSIDFEPRFQSYCSRNVLDKLTVRPKADNTILWAKYFAPYMTGESIQVLASWSDFITLLLLNPERFEWANSLLISKA